MSLSPTSINPLAYAYSGSPFIVRDQSVWWSYNTFDSGLGTEHPDDSATRSRTLNKCDFTENVSIVVHGRRVEGSGD
jgi:hypothetical protein